MIRCLLESEKKAMVFVKYTLVLVLAIFVAGCNRSPVVPVTGTLSFEDRELPEVCRLSFIPTNKAEGVPIRPNGANMEPDGNYTLTEYKGVEGLMPGNYQVRVTYFDLKPKGNPDREGDWKEQNYDAGELMVEEGAGAVEHHIVVKGK